MTTGVTIIGDMLRADTPLTAVVPVPRIKAGALPDGVELAALLVRRVSGIDHKRLKRGAVKRWVDRVSVTVRAASYRDQSAVIALVVACCADRVGDFSGAQRVSVLCAGTGPDMRGPGDSFEQTTDFRVSYDA